MARVILGVGAGIAAYKACELLRLLKESGHSVRVVPTPDALRFVGEPTWAALSGEPVTTDVWDRRGRGPARQARPDRRPGADRARDRGPARPRGRRPVGRPADRHPAHRPLPGRVRPGHAHRDVGAPGHPGQRGDAPPPRRGRGRAGRRPPHRQGQRQRPTAGASRPVRAGGKNRLHSERTASGMAGSRPDPPGPGGRPDEAAGPRMRGAARHTRGQLHPPGHSPSTGGGC